MVLGARVLLGPLEHLFFLSLFAAAGFTLLFSLSAAGGKDKDKESRGRPCHAL